MSVFCPVQKEMCIFEARVIRSKNFKRIRHLTFQVLVEIDETKLLISNSQFSHNRDLRIIYDGLCFM